MCLSVTPLQLLGFLVVLVLVGLYLGAQWPHDSAD